MKILTIGGATWDVFIQYENPELLYLERDGSKKAFLTLEEGKKIEVNQLTYHSGGGATNSAVSFKRLGFEVATFFKVGADEHGKAIVDELAHEGIDTQFIMHALDGDTGTSFIIPSERGDRTVLAYRGVNAQLMVKEIPFSAIKAQDLLYIASLSGASSALLVPIVEYAKQHSVPVVVNPGGGQLGAGAPLLQQALKNIDMLIMNAAEAELFMHSLQQSHHTTFDHKNFFKEILSRGPRIVVVTNGAQGVHAATADGIFFHKSLPVTIVNSVGAGDAFGSTFVASLLKKQPIEQALLCGILNSASVIAHMGAKTGLLSERELMERVKSQQLEIERFSL
jgi:sugar/nucleoside kinase (ribokinase family)